MHSGSENTLVRFGRRVLFGNRDREPFPLKPGETATFNRKTLTLKGRKKMMYILPLRGQIHNSYSETVHWETFANCFLNGIG